MTTVSVCICTFRRPGELCRLLGALTRQETRGRFAYSIVVADNDRRRSAADVVARFTAESSVAVTYCVEPEQNIARARNQALAHASGDFVAFIDDDEFPADDWLSRMLHARETYGADGVLGPVRPFFEVAPPAWLVRSKLCERPEYATGSALPWREMRTGNALFRRAIVEGVAVPFRPEFGGGGEDQDFFRRMMADGRRFVWCNEAVVHEVVSPERFRRRYLWKRALRRGQTEGPQLTAASVAKSLVAVPLYAAALPATCVLGQHAMMDYSMRLLDHAGKLLAAVGIRPLRGTYLGT